MLGIWWTIYIVAVAIVFYRIFKVQAPLVRRNKEYKRLSRDKLEAMSAIGIGMLSIPTWDDEAQRKEDEFHSLVTQHEALIDQWQTNNKRLSRELKITLPWLVLQLIALLGTFLTSS